MISIFVIQAAANLVPGSEFSCDGDDSDNLVLLENGVPAQDQGPVPSEAAIVAEVAALDFSYAVEVAKSAVNYLRDVKKSLPISSEGYTVDSGDLDVGIMATKINASSMRSKVIASITNSGGIATVTTPKNHHLKTGGTVSHSGADQAEYNISAVVTVTGKKSYTYPIAGSPATATGTLLAFTPITMRFIPTTNEVTFVDESVYKEIYLDVEEYVDGCQINARELKNEVNEATTIEQINSININAGWPDTGL